MGRIVDRGTAAAFMFVITNECTSSRIKIPVMDGSVYSTITPDSSGSARAVNVHPFSHYSRYSLAVGRGRLHLFRSFAFTFQSTIPRRLSSDPNTGLSPLQAYSRYF